MKKIVLALFGTALVAAASSAQADPITLGYSLGGPSSSPTVITSGPGFASSGLFAVPGGNFTIQLQGVGTGPLPEPWLSTDSIEIVNDGSAGGTIYLYVTETGITTPTDEFVTGFGNNSLSTNAITESTYAGTTAFDTTYLLGSATVNPGQAIGNQNTLSPIGLPSTYSVTAVYGVTLGAGGLDDATLQLRVPEPLTLSVFGAGLLGAAALRRRKKA